MVRAGECIAARLFSFAAEPSEDHGGTVAHFDASASRFISGAPQSAGAPTDKIRCGSIRSRPMSNRLRVMPAQNPLTASPAHCVLVPRYSSKYEAVQPPVETSSAQYRAKQNRVVTRGTRASGAGFAVVLIPVSGSTRAWVRSIVVSPSGQATKTGAVYRTTLCILMLEVFYRYMPTTQG